MTVALVSMPLSVSLAVAAHSTPVAGIVTAVWAGLIASFLGGSNFNIVGPTGALSGILATYAIAHGVSALPMLAIMAGVIILIAFVLKLERYLVFVPASTIHGFTLGVAFIIGLNQLNFAFGLSNLPAHERFFENVLESLKHLSDISWPAFFIFSLFLLALFVLLKITPKVPGAIILAPIGIVIGYFADIGKLPFTLQTLGDRFGAITPSLFLTHDWFFDFHAIIPAATVALVAILETMLSAKIADGMTKTKYDRRKEMLGLGLANVASGLAGGIPATAALARTALNIKTGATGKTSATINSLAVALISLALLGYFVHIPLAVIAAILVFTAVRMVEAHHFLRMYRFDKKSFVIAAVVAVVTIYEDPIVGILFGTAISLMLFMEKLSKGQFELIINDENKKIVQHITGEEIEKINQESDSLVYSIKGQLAYINAQAHVARFESSLNGYKHIVLRLRELYFIDLDGVDALSEIIDLIHGQGREVLITGANPLIRDMLHDSRQFQDLVKAGLVFNRTSDALKHLGYQLEASYHREQVG
ncbi:MAG: inorganic anion transporter, sulfate permease (SulP) subfamily protein [Parcubacteria group bacterium Gr01-1014_19]|nr:MAG: inorganic anion transporter, sulfate permease (SulP) subfamily protein [Parcubacteria group bacterium Gr01-1014_19]